MNFNKSALIIKIINLWKVLQEFGFFLLQTWTLILLTEEYLGFDY